MIVHKPLIFKQNVTDDVFFFFGCLTAELRFALVSHFLLHEPFFFNNVANGVFFFLDSELR